MPQLNQLAEVANSQFFWLLLVLGVIYFAIGKLVQLRHCSSCPMRQAPLGARLTELRWLRRRRG